MNEPSFTDQLLRLICHQLVTLTTANEVVMENATLREGGQAIAEALIKLDERYF